MDTIGLLPQIGDMAIILKRQIKEKLIKNKQYIANHSEALPEIRNWKWGSPD